MKSRMKFKFNKTLNSDLGTHIDGFIAAAAHTFVVGATKDNPVVGKKADTIKAAHNMAEAAIRLVKPENKVLKFFL